jgi:Glycosyl transferase family 2
MTPRVSVLVTTYNRERFVASAIESVLAQTFGDFEVLVTDNQSSDRTVEIASAYASRDSRVRVIVNERNLGQFGNRNRAAAHAAGDFIKYHDSDDLLYPHCLATMVSMIDACPDAAFGLTSGAAWPGGPCPMLLTPRLAYRREFLGPGAFMCGPSGAIFRRSVFHELGGFVDYGAPSDYIFWLHACARVSMALLPADLFWYRMHPDQEFQTGKAADEYATVGAAVWAALSSEACPLDAAEREQAKINVTAKFVRAALRDVRAGRFGLARRRIEAMPPPSAWLRYVRRPRRQTTAGTPLDEHGQYLIPGHRA